MTEVAHPRAGRWLRHLRQAFVLLLLAAAGVVAGRLVVLVLDGSGTAGPPGARPAAAPASVRADASWPGPAAVDPPARLLRRAARVLDGWDADRAAAYARGDPSQLRRLYVRGSGAGARDLRVLEAYAGRGLVVRGLRTQVLSLEVVSADRHRMRLEVTDRRVGGRAVLRRGQGVGVALPQDAPSRHVLELRRDGGRWRVASVSGSTNGG